MAAEIFTLKSIPDMTLAQYSAEESGGVDEVIHQQGLFYRQLNRKGILFDEVYHLIYLYDPSGNPGNRLSVYFRADSHDYPVCMNEFLQSCLISTYYRFKRTDIKIDPMFNYRADLVKRDGMVASSLPDNNISYYTVNTWKINEKARLIGLFRMMQKLERPAAYVVTLKAADFSENMRESFRTQIQYIKNLEKANSGNRDENAEQCLRIYEKFLDSLRSTPHFLCRIGAYANEEAISKMILDSAAAEAVEEGNYRIVCEKGEYKPMAPDVSIKESCMTDTPRGMRLWNSIYMFEEARAFGMFPVLYPGEAIEIPKESAPVYEKDGLYLGKDNNGYDVYFPLKYLSKHAFIAGVPGSGKTYSMLHLSSQLAGKQNNIPILVLEPAKKEYRALAHNEDIPEFMVFSPGSTGSFPLRINPFEFPKEYKLSEHITNLYQVFEGAFDLEGALPFLLQEGLEAIYMDHGWHLYEVNNGQHSYPTTQELFDKVESILESKNYEPEIKGNLTSCLQTRIGSLVRRELGNVFNASESTVRPEEWLRISCVIELEALGKYAGNFLILLLLTIIRENLRQKPSLHKDKPRHVIFLEEAHNIIGPTTETGGEKGNTKAAATQYIVDMLAEVRALGEAIVIADQLPTALAPQVTKNTSLKLGHRITAMDDREMIASTMSADAVQIEKMGSFIKGHALCIYENVQKPFEIQIKEYSGNSEPPGNNELYGLLKERASYETVMFRDWSVMERRFNDKKQGVNKQYYSAQEARRNLEYNNSLIQSEDNDVTLKNVNRLYEVQYFRNVQKMVNDWMDLIFEVNDYCKTNPLFIANIVGYIYKEIKELLSMIGTLLSDYSEEMERVTDNTLESVKSELAWLNDLVTEEQ